MYVDIVPNRKSPPAILLRESYWENGKAKKRTVANLTGAISVEEAIELRAVLARKRKGESKKSFGEEFEIVRSLPYGNVLAVNGTMKKIGLPRILSYRRSRSRDLVVAMIGQQLLGARSKLDMARALDTETATHALGEVLELGHVDEDQLYEALDWLLERQETIETKLAERHLQDGTLVLYDVTSTYFEGRTCPLAKIGYSRDGKKNKLQIVIGLLCNRQGCPVAVEVFDGNTADPTTLSSQVKKVRERFSLTRVVFVGDRGMLTSARIRDELAPDGIDWISALRAPQIKKLMSEDGPLQPSLFDKTDSAEIVHPDFPGERLIACRNPLLAAERKRKREALLQATETQLNNVVDATRREKRRLKGEQKIAERVGRILGRSKVRKHFLWEITDKGFFSFRRNEEKIEQEAVLDGIYVVRTSIDEGILDSEETVARYKGLSVVERAFHQFKTSDLQVRPIHHRLTKRVRAHVLLCMLAYYVEWHMRRRLAPILFDDHAPHTAFRESIVSPAKRSDAALAKAATKRTVDGWPVHSFRSLLENLATINRNQIVYSIPRLPSLVRTTRPTPFQAHAIKLLGLKS